MDGIRPCSMVVTVKERKVTGGGVLKIWWLWGLMDIGLAGTAAIEGREKVSIENCIWKCESCDSEGKGRERVMFGWLWCRSKTLQEKGNIKRRCCGGMKLLCLYISIFFICIKFKLLQGLYDIMYIFIFIVLIIITALVGYVCMYIASARMVHSRLLKTRAQRQLGWVLWESRIERMIRKLQLNSDGRKGAPDEASLRLILAQRH